MQSTAPECPTCGAPLRLVTSLTPIGPARDWVCTDSTCPTIIPEAVLQGERGDLLGAPVDVLMQAPVTPQGGGGGNGRARRQPKSGDREATRARRERRYLDQEAAGGRDRESERGCDRLTSSVHSVRLTAQERVRLRTLAQTYGSESEAMRVALEALGALEAARGVGRDGEGPQGGLPSQGGRG